MNEIEEAGSDYGLIRLCCDNIGVCYFLSAFLRDYDIR